MTFLFELVLEALRNLGRHKLRSFLTALGIIFGVASVMSMMSTGEGARRAILAQIDQLGITNIIVNTKKPPESQNVQEAANPDEDVAAEYGLKFRDAAQILETVPGVTEVLPVHDVEKWIWFKSRRLESKVRGVTPDYFDKLRLVPIQGRALTPVDGEERARVCVVRQRLLREAKSMGDPLKMQLKVGTDYLRIVGVLPDFEFQSPNKATLGIDDRALEIYVPYETVLDRFGITHAKETSGSREVTRVELHQIVCAVKDKEAVVTAARAIKTLLDRFHSQPDYEVVVPLELLESAQKTQRVFNIVLPIIAGISLLVGGIGILNIMLASITERTREIGIRRALGATGGDITRQFLVETVTLSGIGGLLGIALGLGGVWLVETFTEWEAVVTPESVTLSMGISCLTGVVFGLYPARRAAAMDPIDALRHE
ncbi:MAG: ABC transporter permease [Planctomycetes bacterium]|nr:ABC transporter permease [Planctomycetota bacterium]